MYKILIADSNAESSQRAEDRLTFSGHRVQQAATIWDAIQRVEEDEPDLVVVDAELDQSEAFDLIQWIATERGLPVIVTSEDAAEGRCRSSSNADAHVVKTKANGALARTVESLLRAHSRRLRAPQFARPPHQVRRSA